MIGLFFQTVSNTNFGQKINFGKLSYLGSILFSDVWFDFIGCLKKQQDHPKITNSRGNSIRSEVMLSGLVITDQWRLS